MAEVIEYHFWDEVIQKFLSWALPLTLSDHSGEIQLPCHTQFYREAYVVRNWSFQPTATWVTLGNHLAPVEPLDDCSLGQELTTTHDGPRAIITQLSYSWISDPQKECLFIFFNMLSLGTVVSGQLIIKKVKTDFFFFSYFWILRQEMLSWSHRT